MKSVIIFLFILTGFYLPAIAQTEADSSDNNLSDIMTKVFSTKIEIEVDPNLFPQKSGNFYISESPIAMIMCMAVPQSFDKAKAGMEKESKKKDVTIKEKGEFTANGRSVLFQTGIVKKEGKKLVLEMYAVEGNKETTIFVTGFYDPASKNRMGNAIKLAAISAKLAEN